MGESKHTIKQQRFIDKFTGDIKEAADYAGLSYGYCRRLVTKRHIKEAIAKKQNRLSEKVEINQEWVLERYKRLIEYRITDFFNNDGTMKPLSEIPEDSLYAIQGLKVVVRPRPGNGNGEKPAEPDFIKEFKLPEKRSVNDSIAKLLGLVIEKRQIGLDESLEDALREIQKNRGEI